MFFQHYIKSYVLFAFTLTLLSGQFLSENSSSVLAQGSSVNRTAEQECSNIEIAVLVLRLRSLELNDSEFETLVSCEGDAVPALAQALEDGSSDVRASAVYALGQIGSDSYVVVSELIEALDDEDENVRSLAAYSLGQIGSRAEAAVPMLITSFRNDEETQIVRYQAVLALEQIGSENAMSALDESIELVNELKTQASTATQVNPNLSETRGDVPCIWLEGQRAALCRGQGRRPETARSRIYETGRAVRARVRNVRPVFCSLPGISTILPRCRHSGH